MQIYQAVRIQFRKQVTVARQFGISESRVSQILRKVTRYLADLLPGEELGLRLDEAKRAQLIDRETYERRKDDHRKAEMVWEQSLRPLTTTQWTYDGDSKDERNLKKTVITQREQRLSLGAVQTMERINDKLERSGRGNAERGLRSAESGKGRRDADQHAHASVGRGAPFEKLPLPAGLRKEDEALWPKLMREEQELAATRLGLYPGIPLERARVPPGPLWSYYPWRTEAEHNAALLAGMVVDGLYTIEEYFQHLEVLELSKPFAHPNLLTKDRAGRWRFLIPKQVPLPAMPPERAALPEESPERIYWPNQSKAEHYALMRAEMVLRGHLSRDQYDSLNAWASWYMNEKYPDPLGPCAEKFNSSPLAGTKPGPGEAAQEAAPQGTGSGFASGSGPEAALDKGPTSGRGVERDDVCSNSTLTTGQGFGIAPQQRSELPRERGRESMAEDAELPSQFPPPPTTPDPGAPPRRGRFERLLTSGRAMSPARRRRLERQAGRLE